MEYAYEEPQNVSNNKILWSCISRNGTILVEAGDDPFDGAVSETANGILSKSNTPGWEYHTFRNGDGWFNNKSEDGRVPRLKAVKFHVYEHYWEESNMNPVAKPRRNPNFDENFEDEDDNDDRFNSENDENEGSSSEPVVWVFAAVYNPEAPGWEGKKSVLNDVQSYLEKIVGLTAIYRQSDPDWRYGGTLACQDTFAPVLSQRMQEVTYLGTMARLHESLDSATEMMHDNIAKILEREDKLRSLNEKSEELQEMASVFKKNSQGLRSQMMMQNAKYGVGLGTAIAVGVAIIVIPPMIAIL